jgi:hypothetical protein
MGIKVDFSKIPDFSPLAVGIVCRTPPRGHTERWLWELLPAPKARVWLETNIGYSLSFRGLGYGLPYGRARNLRAVSERPAMPPAIQRYFLVECTSVVQLSEARALGDSNIESEAVSPAPGVWVEANSEYTTGVLRELEAAFDIPTEN